MLLLLQLFSAVFCSDDYVRSLFGAPGRDEVEIEYVDGFEILERNLPKRPLRHIREAKYTDPIEDEDYPYPGHSLNRTCTWQKLRQETTKVQAIYNVSNLAEEDLYWHPAGAKQFYATNEAVAEAERVSVRYVIHPHYGRHVPPVWMPPGEMVTLEIKPQAVGRVYVQYNKYMSKIWDVSGKPKFDQRLDRPRFDELIQLKQEVNKMGLPYGATINLEILGDEPVEVIIKGVILCPFFIYGVHSDTEWKNYLSKLPGPFVNLETGNMEIATPAQFVRHATRLNDCMKWYRSAGQISQTAAQDYYGKNPKFGRVLNTIELNFETFVPAGAAVAFVGRNYCHYPPSWLNGFINWDALQGEPWGELHEINHHHQKNWAMAIPAGAGEMSNNVLNLLTFARSNQASQHRTETGGLSGWSRYSCSFFMMNTLDSLEYGLSLYSTMLHFFGYEKMREFIHADQHGLLFDRKEYGGPGSEMLRASVVFGRNMHHHYNFHTVNDSRLTSKAVETVNKLNLPDFHPVTNPYAVGFLTDGDQGFVSAAPFSIPPYDYDIDFVKYMYQRNDTTKFGDHEFKGVQFENGRENAWKEVSKGKYVLTPKENPLEIEEVIVSYKDKKTNEITRVICHFKQRLNSWELKRYNKLKGMNVSSAYAKVATEKPNTDSKQYLMKGLIPPYDGDSSGYLSILSGRMKVDESTNYIFAATTDNQALLYLSESPLSFDPVKDEPYKICQQLKYHLGYDYVDHSDPLFLETGKTYYVALVSYGNEKGAKAYIGINTTGKFKDLPPSFMIGKEADPKEQFEAQFIPRFEKIYTLDKYTNIDFLPLDNSNWTVYKYPDGDFIMNSNNGEGQKDPNRTVTQALTDGDKTTEWRTKWWPVVNTNPEFPMIYEIDLGAQRTFWDVRIGGTAQTKWFDMNSSIEIRLAPSNFTAVNENVTIPYDKDNYSVDHQESIVYQGQYHTSNPLIELGKESTGRYLRIIFYNNSAKWKDNKPQKTSVSSVDVGTAVTNQKVIPMTNKKDIKRNDKWYEVRGGLYFNGKGFTGVRGATIEFTIKKGQRAIGIIGDYYPDMGTATVEIDGDEVATIHDSISPAYDNKRLNFASRSYKTLLFYSKLDPSKEHKLKVEIDDGEVTLAGLLVDEEILTFETDSERYRNYTLGDIHIRPAFVEADNEEQILFDYDQKNNAKPSPKSKGLSTGAIVAIVVTVLVVVAAVIIVAVIFIKKPEILDKFRKKDNEQSSTLFTTV
ncbi:hypothetical protein TRFO_13172 [Tritrichomonas foetus]|uniref:Peptidase M60 domain-containing protein n=1 Tax=Tritrichomonas foetus TaxID=1144522 RepID=A0A1J4L0A8_9EUKA|nr:hypothetical protein TRFO_13172 [Tritrichomonas foetus]|eukprot:OHT16568.1 hypothetical protein TRFO_13172 [Tritrichomonas foetus]